jgi:hypothetical protein
MRRDVQRKRLDVRPIATRADVPSLLMFPGSLDRRTGERPRIPPLLLTPVGGGRIARGAAGDRAHVGGHAEA